MRALFLATPVSSLFEAFSEALSKEIHNVKFHDGPMSDFEEGDHFDEDMGMSGLDGQDLDASTRRQLAGGKCKYNYRELKKWKSLSCRHECNGNKRQSPIDVPRMNNVRWNPAKLDFKIDWDFNKLKSCSWTKPKKNTLGQKHSLNSGCKALCITFKREELNKGNPVKYCVVQMHMHTPSENTVDGEHSHGGIHFVHAAVDPVITSYAVISMFVQVTAQDKQVTPWAQKWLVPYMDDGISKINREQSNLNNADWESLKGNKGPLMGNFWNFKGSLTTPPCTEAVEWFIMTNPVKISTEQYTAYHNLYEERENLGKVRSTARDTQNQNNKSIIYYGKLVKQGDLIMAARGSAGAHQISVKAIFMAILALYLW